ncbi:MAG: hypothetical protein MdMp014T_0505 [Treponematales bacterium]
MPIEKKNPGWLPRRRADVLGMAKAWGEYITPERAGAWGVPSADLSALSVQAAAAETKLEATQGANRGPGATEACDAAFDALEETMKKIKNRHFFLDPLSGDDFVRLGLAVPDREKTETPIPDEAPVFTMRHGDFMVVEVRHEARGRGIGGAVMNYEAVPLGSPAPVHEQLTKSRLLTKPIERVTFPDTMKGMELYASLSWQTSGAKKGPPSDIQSIVLA